jgi:hypothetical protein
MLPRQWAGLAVTAFCALGVLAEAYFLVAVEPDAVTCTTTTCTARYAVGSTPLIGFFLVSGVAIWRRGARWLRTGDNRRSAAGLVFLLAAIGSSIWLRRLDFTKDYPNGAGLEAPTVVAPAVAWLASGGTLALAAIAAYWIADWRPDNAEGAPDPRHPATP